MIVSQLLFQLRYLLQEKSAAARTFLHFDYALKLYGSCLSNFIKDIHLFVCFAFLFSLNYIVKNK